MTAGAARRDTRAGAVRRPHATGRRPRDADGGRYGTRGAGRLPGRRLRTVAQALAWAASISRAMRILSLTAAPAAPPVTPNSLRLISVDAEKPAMGWPS